MLDGYDTPGSRLSERIQENILKDEKNGKKARTASFMVIPHSGVFRRMGNRTFYRLYGLRYFSKNDDPKSYGIQPAIDKANSVVWLKDSVYPVSVGITGKNGVMLEGETMGPFENFTVGTILACTGAAGVPFIDLRAKRWFGLEKIKLQNQGGTPICAVRVGDTTNSANKTKAWAPRSITIDSFPTGILGDTFAPDDSDYINCYIGNNTNIGVDHLSSQSRFFGGSIYQNGIGVRINKDAGGGAQDTSMQFFGTTFSGNPIHLDIASQQNINALLCSGCWLENTNTTIMRTSTSLAGIFLGSFLFDNCTMVTNGGATSMFDIAGGHSCYLEVNGGTLYPITNPTPILCNGINGNIQRLRIKKAIGMDRVTISNPNANIYGTQGAQGFDRAVVSFKNNPDSGPRYEYFQGQLLYVEEGGVEPVVGSVWSPFVPDHVIPFGVNEIITARAHYVWDPRSLAGGIRMVWASTPIGISVPLATGQREDYVDISDFARSTMGYNGTVQLQSKDDGNEGIQVKIAEIIYDY